MGQIKQKLPKPRITFDRLGQVVFTFKQVAKIASRTSPKLFIVSLVLNAIWGFLAIPGFYLEKLVIDKLVENIGNPNWNVAIWAIATLVGLRLLLELVRNLLGNIARFLQRALSMSFEAELERMMGKKLATLDMATIEDPDFQDKFNRIERESGQRAWGLMYPISDIPNYLVGFVSSLGLLLFLSPLVVVGIVVASIPQFFIDSRFIRKNYNLDAELAPLQRIWSWLYYFLLKNRNFMEFKILGLPQYIENRLASVQKDVLTKRYNLQRKEMIASLGGFLPLTIFELAVSIWLIFLALATTITIGSFEMYLRNLRNAQSNLQGLVNSFMEIYENYIYVTDFVWFMSLEPRIESQEAGVVLDAQERYPIEFKNIWFRYRQSQDWVLKDVSFRVNSGDRIAIVGENGAGKSTLIKLLARFYEPTRGKITVGKYDIKELDLVSWRKSISVVFQQFETYPFSAKESVGYGDVERMDELRGIKESIAKTGMTEYIKNLPLKYNNPLAPEFEKGVKPSAGQWQRIMISRMLFRKNASIVILDEPTSNVDPEAEEKIFNLLTKKAKDKVLIFVTQRFSTVRLADKILVMDDGKIVEQGNHISLIKKGGKYAHLFKLQAKGYQ